MSALCIFDIYEVIDSEKMGEYRKSVGKTVDKFGDRYLVVGGEIEIIEGDWTPTYPVLFNLIILNWHISGLIQTNLPDPNRSDWHH